MSWDDPPRRDPFFTSMIMGRVVFQPSSSQALNILGFFRGSKCYTHTHTSKQICCVVKKKNTMGIMWAPSPGITPVTYFIRPFIGVITPFITARGPPYSI